jgi:outer membrane protein assembly factor BamB
MVGMRWFAVFCVVAAVGGRLSAQDAPKVGILIGEEKRVRDEIDVADRLAGEGRPEEALRRYQQILAESGDALVGVDGPNPRRFLPARWLVHRRIAELPPAVRTAYRRSVEAKARQWLEQGQAQRDRHLLERVVSEAFCSESAEMALDRLGDLALERAEFELAEHYWLMLADYPQPRTAKDGVPSPRLRFPDPKGSEALVQAKLILGLFLRGEQAEAKRQWDAFRQKHPDAQGNLAGRSGRLADILQSVFASDPGFAVRGVARRDWPTFGGEASRGRIIDRATVPYWPDVPTWRAALPGKSSGRGLREFDPPLGTVEAARNLAFHPVIVPGYVLVADAARILVFGLHDGRLVDEYDHRVHAGLPASLDLRIPVKSDVVYTLTADGDRIYARFGRQPMAPPDTGDRPEESESVIVCLELRRLPQGRAKLVPRWQVRSRMLDSDPPALFEGAPLVHEGRLFVAHTRFEGKQSITAIECYDADSSHPNEPPSRRWRQEVSAADRAGETPRYRHDLLTLAGTNVLYCTHSGAIVALDARTGRRAWAFRYPVAPPRSTDGLLPRDLAPCLFASGRVYAVPADSDRIYCLDASTGELLWDSGPTYAIHLLGVSQGRLFATLGGFPQGLRAYDAATGRILWTKPDEGDRATFGRGLLSERFVFWPTRMGLRVLYQEDGELADPRSSAEPWGNLALADGYLVVATPTEIWGFVPPRAQLGQRQKDAAENPNDPLRLYDWAMALADAGQRAPALEIFDKAARLSVADDRRFGLPLIALIDHRRRELLEIEFQEMIRLSQSPDRLAEWQRRASQLVSFGDRFRLWMMTRASGSRALPDAELSASLGEIWLEGPAGLPIRADCWLLSHLTEAERREWDRRIESRADSSKSSPRPLPLSVDRWQRLLQEARDREKDEPERAAAAYRRLLEATLPNLPDSVANANHPTPSERLAALDGLIRLAEASGEKDSARWLRVRRRQETGNSSPAEPLSSVPPAKWDWPVPWISDEGPRLGDERCLEPMRDPLATEEANRLDSEGRVFFCAPDGIQCRSFPTGSNLWKQSLPHDASGYGIYGDSVIVAGRGGITRLRRRDGKKIWEYVDSPRERGGPTAWREPWLRRAPWPEDVALEEVVLAGPRLVGRRGDQCLIAWDVETGLPEWQFRVPGSPCRMPAEGAGIGPYFLATPDHVVLQTTGGELMVLSARDGRSLYRRAAPIPWTSPPVWLDGEGVVYAEGPTLRAINLADGRARWNVTPPGVPSLSGSAPMIRRDGGVLLGIWERNYGDEFVALELDSGRPVHAPVLLGAERYDMASAAVFPEVIVFIGQTKALGIERRTGRRLWSSDLPGLGRWRAWAMGQHAVLHPERSILRAEPADLGSSATGSAASLLTLAGWQETLNRATWTSRQRLLSVHAIDPVSGKSRHAQAFSADTPQAVVLGSDSGAVVLSGSQWFVIRPR